MVMSRLFPGNQTLMSKKTVYHDRVWFMFIAISRYIETYIAIY